MKYVLYTVDKNSYDFDEFLSFDSDFFINDISCFGESGFVFTHPLNHFLSFLNLNGNYGEWKGVPNKKGCRNGTAPLFSYPYSLCYDNSLEGLFVLENNGFSIRFINKSMSYCESSLGELEKKKFESKYSNFLNLDGSHVFCCSYKGTFYWGIKALNIVFSLQGNDNHIEHIVGDGTHGFSFCSDSKMNQVGWPTSIVVNDKKDSFYIAEESNCCIRGKEKVIAGKPMKKGMVDGGNGDNLLTCPSKMCLIDDKLFFEDNNHLRCLHMASEIVETIQERPLFISLCEFKNNLFVLENK